MLIRLSLTNWLSFSR